jgi:ribosomal protein S18 acetylase RimI-like enzyme
MNMSSEHTQRLLAARQPRRATPEDAGALTQLFVSTFFNDPVFNWTVRHGLKREVALGQFFFWYLHKRAIPAGEVWMDGDGTTCAVWFPPDRPASPRGFTEQLKLLPLYIQVCGFARLRCGAAMSAAMEKYHPHDRHFYLLFLAVAPRFQGLGLGSAILEATLKRVDAAHMPAYLENSNPRNTQLYERAGFMAQKNISPEGAPPMLAMWRTARNKE